ncbi:hypothetical protein HGB07_08965 [Candidatus Roizmanbacteria bacterium]|nr:hypothetical protein [Candidatus Roizmanbacteria bacterium]
MSVPWVGFQTSIDPTIYSDEYFKLLEDIFGIAHDHELKVILRIGYTHEIGITSTPDHYTRVVSIFSNPKILTAWQDYLLRLNTMATKYDNFQFGFLTWEDFFLVQLTQISENERLNLAATLGFTDYIKKYPLIKISGYYKRDFQHYSQVPLPSSNSPAIPLLHEFWDTFLLKLHRESKKYFQKLSMEVRVDCDPSPGSTDWICHDKTFDIGNNSDTTLIYFSPAWGAENKGRADSAEQVLTRLNSLLETIRKSTNNSIFIDQFNFVDNTPGFGGNNKINPAELPKFIEKSLGILSTKTIGYALWTMNDVVGNCLINGSFERGDAGWKINNGTIYFDQLRKESELILSNGGNLEQNFLLEDFVNPGLSFTLTFNAASQAENPVELAIQIIDKQGLPKFQRTLTISVPGFSALQLTDIPLIADGTLRINNRNGAILLDNIELYYRVQENGIYDIHGHPRPFRDATLALNKALTAPGRNLVTKGQTISIPRR